VIAVDPPLLRSFIAHGPLFYVDIGHYICMYQ
jgi:hypothetical protein